MDHTPTPKDDSTNDTSEFTPRPSSYEPTLASMLRPFDPAPISKAPSMVSTASTAATEDSHDHGSEAQEAGDMHEGDIIAPTSPGASHWPASPTSQTSFNASVPSPSLRLVEPLGQGAFSAVWLAEDLSAVPLALTSKKSVRDLKRQASLSSKGGLSRNGSLKSGVSRNGSSKGSGWGMVSRNSSLRKLKARLKGMKPVGIGKEVLEDHAGGVGSGALTMYVDDHGRLRTPTSQSTTSKTHRKTDSAGSLDITWGLETPSSSLSRSNSARSKNRTGSGSSTGASSRLVAVKLTPRRPSPYSPQAEERTRVGFVREVEVLRHISHPNITPLLAFFSTPTHHVLVLPYLRGGDLLSLVNDDQAWNNLSESVLRRIWCEICRAVGWMHGVGLVHRDVKLENVLLTWDGVRGIQDEARRVLDEDSKPICCSPPQDGLLHSIPTLNRPPKMRVEVDDLPSPLIKLTDFGLSRFIDIGNGEKGQGELLSTRCGSEAYAAPELVMGSSSYSYATPVASTHTPSTTPGAKTDSAMPTPTPVSQRKGVYDARETDAWACGVVLYALVGRKLPFGEGAGVIDGRIGGERAPPTGFGGLGYGHGKSAAAERRGWLMRIARGDWVWPAVTPTADDRHGEGEELVGAKLARSEGARRIVGRLLVRDPRKRARIVDLWEDEWMRADAVGEAVYESLQDAKGESSEGILVDGVERAQLVDEPEGGVEMLSDLGVGGWEPLVDGSEEGTDGDYLEDEDGEEEEEEEEDGWLLDEEGIGSIARQEVV